MTDKHDELKDLLVENNTKIEKMKIKYKTLKLKQQAQDSEPKNDDQL